MSFEQSALIWKQDANMAFENRHHWTATANLTNSENSLDGGISPLKT